MVKDLLCLMRQITASMRQLLDLHVRENTLEVPDFWPIMRLDNDLVRNEPTAAY